MKYRQKRSFNMLDIPYKGGIILEVKCPHNTQQYILLSMQYRIYSTLHYIHCILRQLVQCKQYIQSCNYRINHCQLYKKNTGNQTHNLLILLDYSMHSHSHTILEHMWFMKWCIIDMVINTSNRYGQGEMRNIPIHNQLDILIQT